MAADPRWIANTRVAQAASGSANELVSALAEIIQSGDWREFPHPMRGMQRYERFADYCVGWVELSPEAVLALLDQTIFKADAKEVRRLLAEGIEPLGPKGTNQHGENVGVCNTNSEQTDATYLIARLKRDHPELAQQVVDQQLTANAAAIAAGIRRPRASIRTDDPDAAVRALLKHYTRQQIINALEAQ